MASHRLKMNRKGEVTKGFILVIIITVSLFTYCLYSFVGPDSQLLTHQTATQAHYYTNNVTQAMDSSNFLVSGSKCNIPNVDPYHQSIVNYLKPAAPIICSKLPLLTYTSQEKDRQVLKVDVGIVTHYVPTIKRLACCYATISRRDENNNIESKCIDFELEVILDMKIEFLYVQCHDKQTNKKVYNNMHAVVQVKENNGARRLNVLMLGIDSMSRLNLMRTMPRTVAHLQANNWLELRGYNKVGDNTLPNLLAILTGLQKEQVEQIKCWPKKGVDIDECPFIWHDFKQQGYYTAYAEDEPILSTFNYKGSGFKKPPADYYFRPFMLSAVKKLKMVVRNNFKICLGPMSTTEHFLKLAMDLFMAVNKSLFALIWLNNFSHNDHNTPAAMDNRFLEFMEELKTSDALNNTLILFMSDHGPRFGEIRQTFVGWLEERLPFFYIWIPEWFADTYPDAYKNLKENGNKLTSPFDLHLTLKEVVEERFGMSSNGSEGCPTCKSLFSPIPINRSCEDAGITVHWCTCTHQTETSISSKIVQGAALFAINLIKSKLIEGGNETLIKCAELRLNKILNARIRDNKLEIIEDYILLFNTLPGLAIFESTVRYWPQIKPSKYKVMGVISRINSYATNSKCISDKELKLYCHCLDS